MKIKGYFRLITSILICQLAGFIGSVFTSKSVAAWYLTIEKPFFNPPNWVFAPVWAALFALMGVSLYIVWSKGLKAKGVGKALAIFGIQLLLNMLWSALFFGLKSPIIAFIEIIMLWAAILFTIIYFYKISKAAAYLLIPYILWVSFAAVLNLSIVVLNSAP